MTILTVVQDASMMVGLARPDVVYTSTDRDWMEMRVIANEAAAVIARAYEWQRLKVMKSIAGDGAAEAFDLPADYGRMLSRASLWSSRYRWDMQHVVDTDDWLSLDVIPNTAWGGLWTIYGNQIHVRPILLSSETAKFFYISRQIVSGGKAAFTADADTFLLSERLLRLCIIYLWKQSKGQDFIAELSDYEMALRQEMADDGGSKPVISGNQRARSSNVWPGTVLP